jgi:hypothetical protein
MSAPENDPPRKNYGFKAREFKRDNATGPAAAPPTAKELAVLAGPAVASGPGGAAGPKAADPNDVYQVLRQNRAAEHAHHLDDVNIRPTSSRRARDFWLILVGGNLAIIGAVWLSGLNPVTAVFGLAGLVVFSIGLTWIMWQVMDRY